MAKGLAGGGADGVRRDQIGQGEALAMVVVRAEQRAVGVHPRFLLLGSPLRTSFETCVVAAQPPATPAPRSPCSHSSASLTLALATSGVLGGSVAFSFNAINRPAATVSSRYQKARIAAARLEAPRSPSSRTADGEDGGGCGAEDEWLAALLDSQWRVRHVTCTTTEPLIELFYLRLNSS